MNPRRAIAVVGGGATGLAAAHALARSGQTVRLFEASDLLGGAVQSVRDGDWLIEAGPNSLQENSPALTALIADLGLDHAREVAQPGAKHRFIFRHGRPQAVPLSPPALLTSPLFSIGGRLRILTEWRKRPRIRSADISLADLVRAHFGDDVVDYGLNPFVSGVYAGDAEKLSARQAFPTLWKMERETGSLLRGQLRAARTRRARGAPPGPPPIISFQDGLGMLPAALAATLPHGAIELNARVKSLVRGEGVWNLLWSRDGDTSTETFDRIVLALPAPALAQLTIGPLGERPLAELADIVHPPVASLFLGYHRNQVAHPLDGFGLLLPQKERRQVLGILFSSSLFANRAPTDHVGLTLMFGGVFRPDLGRAELDELLPVARRELADLLGVTGEPVHTRLHRWPQAIPQYDLGYGRFLQAMQRTEHQHPGLLIGGQARDGISLPACLAAGQDLARRARE